MKENITGQNHQNPWVKSFLTYCCDFKPNGKKYIRKNRWLPTDSLIDNIFKTSKIKCQDIIKRQCFEKLSVVSHWSKAWKWPLKINLKLISGFTNSETDTNFKLQSSKEKNRKTSYESNDHLSISHFSVQSFETFLNSKRTIDKLNSYARLSDKSFRVQKV